MPKKESLQHKLERVRPPRVNITYDVEVGGAIELKELPFVVGVLGDFVGKPEELDALGAFLATLSAGSQTPVAEKDKPVEVASKAMKAVSQ